MILKTNRLVLRTPKKSDAQDIVRNINNLDISKWLLFVPYPYNIKDALYWINNSQKRARVKPQVDYAFGIELREEKSLIGGIGIHHVDRFQGSAEVGYWIGSTYHHKGYGSEALKAVLDFSFNRLKLRRLEAGVFAGNPSSGKLLEKFGFKQEGFKKKARRVKATGKIVDEYIYGLLREDYVKSRN